MTLREFLNIQFYIIMIMIYKDLLFDLNKLIIMEVILYFLRKY